MSLALNIGAAVFASLGSFLFGYDSGVIGSVLGMTQFQQDFPTSQQGSISGAIVSVFAGGAVIGAAAAGYLCDKLGRKRAIQVGCLFGILGCSLMTGMRSVDFLIAGRAIAGISIGILSMGCPLYLSEIAPYKYRGAFIAIAQQMIGFGFITSSWTSYGTSFIQSEASYRVALSIQIIPAVFLVFGAFILPESPRWLILKGRTEEALVVVKRFHGAQGEIEFQDMVTTIQYEQAHTSRNVSVLWSTRAMRHRLFCACGVQAMGQFTGINVINYFGPRIYQSLGIVGNKALLVQGLQGIVGPITNLFFLLFLIDRVNFGRRNSLIFGAIGIAACLSIEMALNSVYPPNAENIADSNEAAQRAAISMFFLSSIIFSLSFGPVSWTYASEVWPSHARSMGSSAATMTNWTINVILSQISPIALDAVAWKYYSLFVAMGIINAVLIYLYFPETAGKTLEEIDELFGDREIQHIDVRDPHALESKGLEKLIRDDTYHVENRDAA